MPYLLLLPGTLFLVMFMFYPLISIFRYAMMNYDMSNLRKKGYIGLENFRKIVKDPIFLKSLGTSAKWVLTQVTAQLILGMSLALLLDQKFFGRGVYRCLVFFPWAIAAEALPIRRKWILYWIALPIAAAYTVLFALRWSVW